jgi:hypothetical protein
MTTRADPPDGAITYVQWLQWQIAGRLQGVVTICGPPIADWPTAWERITGSRPDAALERQLERRLHELERRPPEPRAHAVLDQAHAEPQAG